MPRRSKKTKRTGCWWYAAGKAPLTVTVHERAPGGVLYVRMWDPSAVRATKKGAVKRGAQVRESLGHRDRELAIKHAEAEAGKLRAGDDALAGRPTVAGVLQLYLLHRSPAKGAVETRQDDKRHAEFWSRLYGTRLVSELGDQEWNEAIRLRSSGIVDVRGNPVPEPQRKTVGARGVDSTLVFINAVFNWALGYKVKGKKLIESNPFGAVPGVKRTLERPKNLSPLRPIATYDRFLVVRAKAPHVLMYAKKGQDGARLVETGRAQFKHGEGPIMLWMRPSYLPELLDLSETTGRRITAICELWFSDFIRVGGVVSKIRWRPFKGAKEQIVPLSDSGRAAIECILATRPGMGDTWVFPSPKIPEQPITRRLASQWLRKAEALAGVGHLKGGSWHPLRRKWATERKHLPDVDVMAAGGWEDDRSLKQSYQQSDDETMLAVVNEPRKLVEKKNA